MNIHTALCGCADSTCQLLGLLSTREPIVEEIRREQTNQKWMISTKVILDVLSSGTNTVLVVRDVTQERAMQDCLIEAEKKASNLRASAALAEQITPSIRYCLHYLAMLSKHVTELRSAFCDYRIALNQKDSSQPAGFNWEEIESRYSVEFILQDIAQAVKLTQNDLRKIFSTVNHISNMKDSCSQMSPLKLEQLVEDATGFMQDELGDKIILESSYPQELPAIRGNPLRLQIALTSLLELIAQSSPIDSRIKINTLRSNGYVQVLLESEQCQFESSSEQAQETDPEIASLDLELITNIIEDHGGTLQFNNNPNHAAAITVCLPVYEPVEPMPGT